MPDDSDKTNILIVDDLPEKVLVYRSILEDLGENLVFARSGEEALREILRSEFAVILLDVQMPGMDAFETAALIRRRKKSHSRQSSSSPRSPTRSGSPRGTPRVPSTISSRRSSRKSCGPRSACSSTCTG